MACQTGSPCCTHQPQPGSGASQPRVGCGKSVERDLWQASQRGSVANQANGKYTLYCLIVVWQVSSRWFTSGPEPTQTEYVASQLRGVCGKQILICGKPGLRDLCWASWEGSLLHNPHNPYSFPQNSGAIMTFYPLLVCVVKMALSADFRGKILSDQSYYTSMCEKLWWAGVTWAQLVQAEHGQ